MIQFGIFILLIILSAYLHARHVNKGKQLNNEATTQFAAVLFWSSLLLSWGNITEMFLMFTSVLCIYRPFRNIFEHKSMFYINQEKKLGQMLHKYRFAVHTIRIMIFTMIILVYAWK